MTNLITLSIKLPRNTQVTPEAAKTFLSALTQINYVSPFQKLLGTKAQPLALEIGLINQQIIFLITCDTSLTSFIETQIQSTYPLALIDKVDNPLAGITFETLTLSLSRGSFYPIATYDNFQDVDPLSSVLSVLSKSDPDEVTVIQFALQATNSSWQAKGSLFAQKGLKRPDGTYSERSDAKIINDKISYPGFKCSVRLISNTNKTLNQLASSFGVFNRSDANFFVAHRPSVFNRKKENQAALSRHLTANQILNIMELATLWHLPSDKIKIPSILWGTSVLTEAPSNLPAATDLSDEEKSHINFFAKTLFKNHETIFGIKDTDRLRHVWSLGKTGTGKSTMIANMAIDDFKKGRGVAIIDPHGDLCDDLLDYIPKGRINDTIYFNPADKDYPIVLNPLEVTNREEAELVASGLMSIFTKVWANVWSARMEYILRNSFLTLAEIPNSTLADVLKLLANQSFRNKILAKTTDPALTHFWREEFEKMPDRLQKEAIAPIQNKVGQFVTSPLIRRMIGTPKSTISLDEIMEGQKIFIANLSQGRLGEDNATLLGATLITKFQLAAMRRVNLPKEKRIPFYLYVDEFQNFATDSFMKILSEARKFGLALTLANQYMAQIPEFVQKAILGNAGTLISFAVGAEDANIIFKEYAEVFSQNDLVNLQNFQIALKLTVDGHTTRPFLATTLPLPASKNQNREKVIRVSRERYTRKTAEKLTQVEAEIEEVASPLTEDPEAKPQEPPVPPKGTVFENN